MLLTIQEVATELRVSPQSLWRWRRDGGGPPFVTLHNAKKWSSIRYDAAKLEQWIDEQTDKATAGG